MKTKYRIFELIPYTKSGDNFISYFHIADQSENGSIQWLSEASKHKSRGNIYKLSFMKIPIETCLKLHLHGYFDALKLSKLTHTPPNSQDGVSWKNQHS